MWQAGRQATGTEHTPQELAKAMAGGGGSVQWHLVEPLTAFSQGGEIRRTPSCCLGSNGGGGVLHVDIWRAEPP